MAGKPAELMVIGAVRCNQCGAAFGACECWLSLTDDPIPTATHSGVLKIGEAELRCHVLSNGLRIFDGDDLARFFGDMGVGGRDGRA